MAESLDYRSLLLLPACANYGMSVHSLHGGGVGGYVYSGSEAYKLDIKSCSKHTLQTRNGWAQSIVQSIVHAPRHQVRR
jgi:hypothetical protein